MQLEMGDDIIKNSEETGVCKTVKRVVSYQVFVLEHKNKLQGKYPFLKAHQINRKLKFMWDALSLTDKSNYRKCTLISTPTPPKKVAKKVSINRAKTCKGRLLTPKSYNTFSAKKTPTKPKQSPVKPVKDVEANPVILDQYDQKLLGPYLNSDDDMSDGGFADEDDSINDTSPPKVTSESLLPKHWESKMKTYDGVCFSVEKSYNVPKIVGISEENDTRTPGILKRNGKEKRRSSGRVSFSTEEVDIKIMSEREDSCSTMSPSQDKPIHSLQSLPESDENPYDFDAIDKFEIYVSTPHKSSSVVKASQREKSPVEKSQPVSESVSSKPKASQKGVSRKRDVSSPSLSLPAKRMLRSRSPNVSKAVMPGKVERGKCVYKFDELSSSPCTGDESGRGDAEKSFHEPEGSKESVDVRDNQRGRRFLVHSGGDNHLPSHNVNENDSQITPKLDKTESSTVAVAPRKRRQLIRNSSVVTPKQLPNDIPEIKDSAPVGTRRSPRLKPHALEVQDCRTLSLINEIPPTKTKPRKPKGNKSIVETKENDTAFLDSKIEDFGLNIFGNLEDQDNPCTMTQSVYIPKPVFVDAILEEDSSAPDDYSPASLHFKSQLSVAETLRGLKRIASPDNQDLSDSSIDGPKLLSPTLSDISVLSSVSSTGSAGNDAKGKGCTTSRGDVFTSSEIFKDLRSHQKPKPQQSFIQKPVREPLCDMFDNLTPPDQQIISSRRMLSSSKREGICNFDRLFEEEDIFG